MTPVTDDSTAQTNTAQADVNDDLAKALASVQGGGQAMGFESVGEPPVSPTPAPAAPVITAAPTPPVSPTTTPSPTVLASDAVPTPGNEEVEYSTPPAGIDHDDTQSSGIADSIEQIKISALQQLRPLMQHIELTPEEKFEKYLMMLRASDDPELIKPTYDAAQMIGSEKLKAQALLDVINEINYLTSQQLVS